MKKITKIKNFSSKALKHLFRVVLIFILISLFQVLLLKWVDPFTSSIMLQRKITILFSERIEKKVKFEWYSYEEISKYMPLAVVAAEDQNFPFHYGFDFEQINKAIKDKQKGKRLRGASTITQQVAKNLFLWEGKSFIRKGFEAYYTALIEFLLSKRRIIEIYLNIAETGDSIFGVGAAAKNYFGKLPSKLTKEESALITAVLPNPKRYSVKHPTEYTLKRQNWILKQMKSLGGVTYLKDL